MYSTQIWLFSPVFFCSHFVNVFWNRSSVDGRLLKCFGCLTGTPLKEFCRLYMDLIETLWSVRNSPATSVNQRKFCSRWMFKMPNSTSTSSCCVLSLLSSESAVTLYWGGGSRLNDEKPRRFLFKNKLKDTELYNDDTLSFDKLFYIHMYINLMLWIEQDQLFIIRGESCIEPQTGTNWWV